jgi:hypothetical protein
VVSVKLGTFYLWGKSTLYPLDRRLIKPQSGRLNFFSARKYYVGFEAFMAVTLKNSIFWVISQR